MTPDPSFKERIKKSGKIFIVGVAGDSGSGKTTFAGGIKKDPWRRPCLLI